MSSQLVETFNVRPLGPHTLQSRRNEATEPFKKESGEAGCLISTDRNSF